jgi:cathepsin D
VATDQIPDFLGVAASGIMGLGFSALSSTRSTPFWQALGSQLAAPEMAFYFTRFKDDSSARQEEPGGVFTLGGVDPALFTGSIEFLPMPSSNPTYYWLLTMSGKCRENMQTELTSFDP